MDSDTEKTLVVIRAFNEEKNILSVAAELREKCPAVDFVVVNDGSTDSTGELCRSSGIALLELPINLGLSGAFYAGIRYAKEEGYSFAVQLDGDGQHDPAYIEPMFRAMRESHADMVVGSRFLDCRRPFTLRMLGSRLISAAIWLATGQRFMDPTSGLRLYNRALICEFANNQSYSPEPDTMALIMRRKYKVIETPVRMRERMHGTSYFNLATSIRFMLEMTLSILLVCWFRRRER